MTFVNPGPFIQRHIAILPSLISLASRQKSGDVDTLYTLCGHRGDVFKCHSRVPNLCICRQAREQMSTHVEGEKPTPSIINIQ